MPKITDAVLDAFKTELKALGGEVTADIEEHLNRFATSTAEAIATGDTGRIVTLQAQARALKELERVRLTNHASSFGNVVASVIGIAGQVAIAALSAELGIPPAHHV